MNNSKFKRPLSITAKLALWYSLSAFCLIISCTFLLYWALTKSLERQNGQFLANEIAIIRTVLTPNAINLKALQQQIPWQPKALSIERNRYFCRIMKANGQKIIETPHMQTVLPIELFPSLPDNAGLHPIKKSMIGNTGKPYLLMSAWDRIDRPVNERRMIQVAVDTHNDVKIISDYRRNLLLVLFFGLLGAVVIGILVAKRGMQPLRHIAEQLENITLSRLHERLNIRELPAELETLANNLNDFLSRIEAGFKKLTQFSVDLAHELRTPINNLMGETELALNRARSNEEYRLVLESSAEEFMRLSRLIDSLLFIARSENPQEKIECTWMNLNDTLQKICDFHEALALEKEVSITFDSPHHLFAEPILFRQAISNLLVNALRYTPKGGHIHICSKKRKEHQIEISVSDTGIGIASDQLPHIFDRFYRADRARSYQAGGGTGLGLAIVKSIMELHQGTIAIESTPQKGTTVTLVFPNQD